MKKQRIVSLSAAILVNFFVLTSFPAKSQEFTLSADTLFSKEIFWTYTLIDTMLNGVRLAHSSYPEPKDMFGTAFVLDSCRMTGENYLYSWGRQRGRASVSNSKIDDLFLYYPFFAILKNDSIKKLFVSGGGKTSVLLEDSYIQRVFVFIDTLSTIQAFSDSKISNLSIFETFVEALTISELPDTIDLRNISVSDPLNLKRYEPNKVTYISLTTADVDKIDWEYNTFKLIFPYSNSYDEIVAIYKAVLESFQRRGYLESYEKLDKEFKEFKYLNSGVVFGVALNWINKKWWEYGYDKSRVVVNSIYLNLFFFIINSLCYRSLLKRGYRIGVFVKMNNKLCIRYRLRPFVRFLKTLPFVFLYTCYIFWGLRLEIKNIQIRSLALTTLVIVQYLAGLVCLAYLANYIITI